MFVKLIYIERIKVIRYDDGGIKRIIYYGYVEQKRFIDEFPSNIGLGTGI